MSGRKKFIEALEDRLSSITTANGYPLTIRRVFLNDMRRISMDIPSLECPSIEIIQEVETFEQQHQNLIASSNIYLRLVDVRSTTDEKMELFKSAVVRCLFNDSYDSAGGSKLGHIFSKDGQFTNTSLSLKSCVSDLGMINANRIYALQFTAKYHVNIFNY